jgi:hypothetical protein
MKKNLICYAIGFLTLFLSQSTFAQTSVTNLNVTDWTEIESPNAQLFEIYYETQTCPMAGTDVVQEYVVLSFNNITDLPITLTYDLEFQYTNYCANCDATSPEFHYEITLNSNQSTSGTCDKSKSSGLRVFKQFTTIENKNTLKSFKVKNLELL